MRLARQRQSLKTTEAAEALGDHEFRLRPAVAAAPVAAGDAADAALRATDQVVAKPEIADLPADLALTVAESRDFVLRRRVVGIGALLGLARRRDVGSVERRAGACDGGR